MLGQNLRQLYESLGPRDCVMMLRENLESGEFKPSDFSLQELAESFCGYEWHRKLNPRTTEIALLEAGEAVDVSAFSNITGQIMYSAIHEGWEQGISIADDVCTNKPTKFSGERIPGVAKIASLGERVQPGMGYPVAGYGEHYWDTPATDKRGLIAQVTKEAVFFDHTGRVITECNDVGERLARNKARRILAVLAGITVTIGDESFNGNNHSWDGTTYNTYSTTANAIGINALASNPLNDWTDLEALDLLFADLLHPDTSEPMEFEPTTLITMPAKKETARRIVQAVNVRSGPYATSNPNIQYEGPNPYAGLTALSSALLYRLIIASGVSASNAADWFFYGDPKAAIWYMENWPLTVVTAPKDNEAEFTNDIVLRVKASERGTPWMKEPRKLSKSYNG